MQPEHARRTPLPSVGDFIFLAPIYLLVVVLPNFVFGDGSTGWHLVAGQYIIDHLRIPHQDLISYTFPTKPWVAYEWLFDFVAALLVKIGDLRLLAVATASAIALLFLLIYGNARRTGCHFLIVLAVTLIGSLTSSLHWLARPHLVTFFGVYIFSSCLERFHRNRITALQINIILGLTMLVWANAHPGFVVGFVMVAIYLVSEAIAMAVLPRGEARRLARNRAGTLLASLPVLASASLINPNGGALYSYIAAYMRQGALLSQTQEFMSPTFHGELHATCLELLFAAIVFGLATSRRRPWLGQGLLMLAFAHLALSGMRNEPLFVIVAVPFIAELFAENNLLAMMGADGAFRPSWLQPLTRRWQRMAQNVDAMEFRCTMHLLPVAVVAVLASSCIVVGGVPGMRPLVSSHFDSKEKPTTTLDYITNNHLPWDRGFSLDNWGGYIRYKTGQRVFIDDRLDFYGGDFYLRYVRAASILPGWQNLLDEYKIEWVLFPKDTLLANMLGQMPEWQLKAKDQAAHLFVRRTGQRGSLSNAVIATQDADEGRGGDRDRVTLRGRTSARPESGAGLQ